MKAAYGILEAVAVLAAVALGGAATGGVQAAAGQTAAAKPAARPAGASFDRLIEKAVQTRDAGRLDEAVDLFRQALQVNPSSAEGQWMLGSVLYDLDRHAEARDAFRRVTNLKPTSAVAWAMKGLCEFQLKNHDRALDDLQKARGLGLRDNPQVDQVASYHAAILMNRIERYEVAYDMLKPFASRGLESPSMIEALGLSVLRLPYLPSEAPVDKREMILMAGRAGYMMAQGRRSPAAMAAFEELVMRFPEAPNVHYALGQYLLVEDPPRAIQEFERELKRSPTHVHAMIQIAFELITLGRFEEAVALGEKAVDLAPNLFAARNALGRALLEQDRVDRAIEELETGVKLAPDSPDMYFALARAYRRAGREEDAARARATFQKLDRALRIAKHGEQSVAGEAPESAKPPEP